MYSEYIIVQIHHLFNEFKKKKFNYKCNRKVYILDRNQL